MFASHPGFLDAALEQGGTVESFPPTFSISTNHQENILIQ